MSSTRGSNGHARVDYEDGVAEIRMTDESRRNCLSLAMLEDLYEVYGDVHANLADVNTILLTHDGPVFSSGLDMSVMADDEQAETADRIDELFETCFEWLRSVDRPVVAAPKGTTVAGGGIVLLRSDIIVTSPEFELWFPEIDVGVYSLDLGPRFVEYFGPHRAAAVTFLGEEASLSAEEAREAGLVHRIVPEDEVENVAQTLAGRLSATERDHGNLLDAYRVFNLAKREHLSIGTGARVEAAADTTVAEYFDG